MYFYTARYLLVVAAAGVVSLQAKRIFVLPVQQWEPE
jgi:hypothetical protein